MISVMRMKPLQAAAGDVLIWAGEVGAAHAKRRRRRAHASCAVGGGVALDHEGELLLVRQRGRRRWNLCVQRNFSGSTELCGDWRELALMTGFGS